MQVFFGGLLLLLLLLPRALACTCAASDSPALHAADNAIFSLPSCDSSEKVVVASADQVTAAVSPAWQELTLAYGTKLSGPSMLHTAQDH